MYCLFCLLYYFFSALGTVVWYLLILYVIFLLRVSSVLNRDSSQFGKKFMFDKNEDTCWNSDQVCVVYIRDFKIQRRDSNKNVAWNANLHKKESSEREIKFRRCLFLFSNREVRHFYAVVGQKQERNVQKKCDERADLLFCLLNLLFFWHSFCRQHCWIFKSILSSSLYCDLF